MLLSPILSYYTMERFGFPITRIFSYLLVIYGIVFFISAKKKILIPKYAYFLFFFIVFLQIRIWINGKTGIYNLFFGPHTSVLIMMLIIYNTNFTDRFIKRSISVIKITVIIAAIVSIIQVYYPDFLNAWSFWGADYKAQTGTLSIYETRRVSIFGFIDNNELGLSYMPLLAVLIGFLLYNKNKLYKYFLFFGGITAILTNGRYVIVAFVIITIQIIIYGKIKIKKVFKYTMLAIIGLFLFYQLVNYFDYNLRDWYNERLFAEGSISETTRYKAIGNFLIFFPQKPLFGTGGMTDAIKEASANVGSSQIHVGYLSGLVYYGIVGSFFLFGFWFLLAKKLYKTAKLTNYWGSFFAFIIFLWANFALVTFHIFFYGIIFALVFDKYHTDKFIIITHSNSMEKHFKN